MESYYSIERMVKDRQDKYLREAEVSRMAHVYRQSPSGQPAWAEWKDDLRFLIPIYWRDLQRAWRHFKSAWLRTSGEVWR